MVKNCQCSSLQPGYKKMPTMYTGQNLTSNHPNPLNKRTEIMNKCHHRRKFLLSSFQREDGQNKEQQILQPTYHVFFSSKIPKIKFNNPPILVLVQLLMSRGTKTLFSTCLINVSLKSCELEDTYIHIDVQMDRQIHRQIDG